MSSNSECSYSWLSGLSQFTDTDKRDRVVKQGVVGQQAKRFQRADPVLGAQAGQLLAQQPHRGLRGA